MSLPGLIQPGLRPLYWKMIARLATMRLYFVRHGQSEANVLQVISNRGLEHGLTEPGRAQVSSLARRLAGLPFARLYSSPLLRAVQTAEMLSSELGLPFETKDALREFDCGIIEGKSDTLSWQSQALHPVRSLFHF
jgi:broad specificity phosphatase PhoE